MIMLQIEFWFESVISGYLNFHSPLFTTIGEKVGLVLSIFNLINCLIIFYFLFSGAPAVGWLIRKASNSPVR